MPSMKRPRLRVVQALPKAVLDLVFVDGQHFQLDMSADLELFEGLKPLKAPHAFAGATLGDNGWTVEWLALDIQIGADTLLLDALAQNAPDENTRIFIRWRLRHRMTLERAAEALGVSTRSISRYSNGKEVVPRTLALACLGWETLQKAHVA